MFEPKEKPKPSPKTGRESAICEVSQATASLAVALAVQGRTTSEIAEHTRLELRVVRQVLGDAGLRAR